jgi:hypothetical protein
LAWRQVVRWPDGCEEAFQASRASDDGGLVFEALDDSVLLLQVTCAAGAYQPSSMWWVVPTSAPGGAPPSVLEFQVLSGEKADASSPRYQTEVFGEWVFDHMSRQLTRLSVSRQTGDCGFWARYRVEAGTARLVKAAAKFPCPSQRGEQARLDAARPPTSWTVRKE